MPKHPGPSNDITYLAGIVDGEGYFSIQRVMRPKTPLFHTTLQVANSSLELIQWLQKHFKGSVSLSRPSAANCEDQHVWVLSAKEDLKLLLPFLYPELIVKR